MMINLNNNSISSKVSCWVSILIASILSVNFLVGCVSSQEYTISEQRSQPVKAIINYDCNKDGEEAITDAGSTWSGGKITVDMIAKCKSRQEYLDLVTPCYQFYAQEYGIKWAGVMALQGIYEAGVPDNISNVMRSDNNMGGLKYSSSIPGATQGSPVPSNETGGCYCRFESIDAYIKAAVWNIAHEGSPYSAAMKYKDSSMEKYTRALCSMWIQGVEPADPPAEAGYSESVIGDYSKYGLSKYEGKSVVSSSGSTTSSRSAASSNKTTLTTASQSSGSDSLVGNDNLEKIWNFLKAEGFSDEQVAGIMGNWQQESRLEPTICQGGGHADEITVDGVTGYGLAQWTFLTRQQELKDFAASKNKKSGDLLVQLQFFITEFADSKEEYLKQTTVDEATRWFHNVYENSADTEEMIKTRVSYAQEIYDKMKGKSQTVADELDDSKDERCGGGNEKEETTKAGPADDIWWVQGGDEANGNFPANLGGSTLQEAGCGVCSLAVIVSALTGSKKTPNELVKELPEATFATNELGFPQGYAYLEKQYGIHHESFTNASSSQMQAELEKGRMIWMSADGPFLRNDGGSWSSSCGHYICFYKYSNGKFYAQDSANNAGKSVEYSKSALDSLLNSRKQFAALYK